MERTVVLEQYAKKKSRRNSTLRKYAITLAFLAPFLLAFICFFLYPLFYGIWISFTNYSFNAPGTDTFNNFRWYRMLFNRSEMPLLFEAFWRSFLHSFIFAIIMVPVAIILPLALAILVNTKPPGYKAFRSMIYLPSIVPLTAAGSIFTILFMSASNHGLLYEIFGININWFVDSIATFSIGSFKVDIAYAWIPIFFMCLWGGWGGNFIILNAGLQNVPKSLYEASSIDGCSKWKRILHVTIPGIKGQLVLCLFTTIIGYLGLYGQNYVLCNGSPANPILSSMPGGSKVSTFIYFIQDIVANNPNFRLRLYGLGASASILFALFTGICSGIQMYCTRDRKSGTKRSEDYAKWERLQQR